MDVDAAIRALRADGPLPSRREPLQLFGQFIGTWDLTVSFFDETGDRIFQGPGGLSLRVRRFAFFFSLSS